MFGGLFGVLFVSVCAQLSTISGSTECWFIFWNTCSSSGHFSISFLFPSEPTYPVKAFSSWTKHVHQGSQIALNTPQSVLFSSLSFLASFLLFPYLSAPFPTYSKSSDFLCGFQRRISETLRSRASIRGRDPLGLNSALDKAVILVQADEQNKICRSLKSSEISLLPYTHIPRQRKWYFITLTHWG